MKTEALPETTRTVRQSPRRVGAPPAPRMAPGEEIDGTVVEPQHLAASPAPTAVETNGKADNDLPPFGSRTLTHIHEKLCKPFPLWAVEVKPGATNKEKTRALALAYVDPRSYFTRLDRLAGPEGWAVEYRPIGERAILCRLTILGIVREDVGECDASDPNAATSAAMQAFKRACAAFGMGRYLYSLPQPWVEFDGKRITNPEGAAAHIYQLAGLSAK